MRILAIETTGRTGSLAALSGAVDAAQCLKETRLDDRGRTAQLLAPALEKLLADVDWPARSIELVAVAVGPGSFTGLRIGLTTAKTFAYAIGAQIVGVDTMSVLAAQVPSAGPLWTIIDAQRQELFAAKYASTDAGNRALIRETTIIAEQAWLDSLLAGDQVIGPSLARMRDRLPAGVVASTPEDCWQPTASTVGQVGWHVFQRGQRDDVWKLTPKYYRASAAEEKRARST